jgi:hypothetical protein
MKLYTSYWAQVRNFPTNLVGLNTTIWPPKWRPFGQDKRGVIVVDCPILKPGHECEGLCNGKCNPRHPTSCKFLLTYEDQLKKIDMNDFLSKLHKLEKRIKEGEKLDEINFAFIVFEKYDNPCSERAPIQDWIRSQGIQIEEWFPNI